jgi:hypothetical protein
VFEESLLLEDIVSVESSKPSPCELTGKILSSAGGTVKALGGYGTISINNSTNNDLILNGLDASKRGSGVILIKDKARGTSTNPLVSLYESTGEGIYKNGAATGTSLGSTFTYDVASNWRYGWTIGMSLEKVYRSSISSSSWLFFNLGSSFSGPWQTVEVRDKPTLQSESAYYYLDNSITEGSANDNYTYQSIDTVSGGATRETSKRVTKTWYGKKTVHVSYMKVDGVVTEIRHSVEADRDVNVQFYGSSEGRINIASTGSGKVTLKGQVLNPTGITTISSTKSVESQGDNALVGGRDLTITAGTSIGSAALNPLRTRVTDTVLGDKDNFGARVIAG